MAGGQNPLPARKGGKKGGEPATGGPAAHAPAGSFATPDYSAEEFANLAPPQKAQALNRLDESEVRGCVKCVLSKGRTQTVFGEGEPSARIAFVGEGPGEDEDRTGRPFVGKAGQLLTKMILAMGISRESVYICNMVKCRPPGNRTPLPDEVQACWSYLVRQLAIIRPEVVVTLGNPATQGLLGTKEGITKIRGQWRQLPDIGCGLAGTPVMPTFHPSYVLRQYTPDVRGKVWDDLQKVMDRLGMPKSNPGR
ncbi:MAG: uracil-DNA glycosylase [Planctomycetes bacterium]|nr:uracil-DNA glycosylase [Planctomycetota bacterium]